MVDDSVLHRGFPAHEVVAVSVLFDLLDRLASVLRQDLVQAITRLEHLASMNVDVGRLSMEAPERLMDHDPGVREGEALALFSACEQNRAHAGRHADADGAH